MTTRQTCSFRHPALPPAIPTAPEDSLSQDLPSSTIPKPLGLPLHHCNIHRFIIRLILWQCNKMLMNLQATRGDFFPSQHLLCYQQLRLYVRVRHPNVLPWLHKVCTVLDLSNNINAIFTSFKRCHLQCLQT